jgi:hypothetical protein
MRKPLPSFCCSLSRFASFTSFDPLGVDFPHHLFFQVGIPQGKIPVITFHKPFQDFNLNPEGVNGCQKIQFYILGQGNCRFDFLLEQMELVLDIEFFHEILPRFGLWAALLKRQRPHTLRAAKRMPAAPASGI